MDYRPVIVAVGYNRAKALKRLLESLNRAEYSIEVPLIISIDYGGSDEVTEIARNFEWKHGKKKVRVFEQNQGLRKHLISCYDYSMEYGAAIVLEDDIVVSPFFYDYACKAWEYYEKEDRVIALALYSPKWNEFANRRFEPLEYGFDVYASKKNESWGECVIGEKWKNFKEWYEHNNADLEYNDNVPSVILTWEKSWCKYFNYFIDTHDYWVITPYISLSTNFNDAGIHMSRNSNAFQQPLLMGNKEWNFGKVDDLPQYDDFLDNIRLKDYLENKINKTVCIDYYGLKGCREKYDLCLSTAILPYEVFATYGLEMRPYELNIYNNVEGEGLILYDMKKKLIKAKDREQHYRQIKYDTRNLQAIDALFYAIYEKFFIK